MVTGGLALVTALHDLTTLCGFCDSGMVLAKGRVSLTLDTATSPGASALKRSSTLLGRSLIM
jgi:ABC-type hemin transport system ATPase subunit